jgi:hypothetical protein
MPTPPLLNIPGPGDAGKDLVYDPVSGRMVLVGGRATFSNANYTALPSDRVLAQTGALSAARVVTLPAASAVPGGTILQVIDESGTATSAFTLSWARAGADTINGAASNVVAVNSAFGVGAVESDGASKWTTIAYGAGSAAGVPLSTVTTKGDLIAATGNAAVARLGVGTNGQILTADSTQTTGVRWVTGSGTTDSAAVHQGDLFINVKDPAYGAKGDGRLVTDGANSSVTNPTTLTSATAAFTSADVGKLVTVSGAGTSGGRMESSIASVTNSTTAVLANSAATTVSSGATVTIASNDKAAFQAALDAAYTSTGAKLVYAPPGIYGIGGWVGAGPGDPNFYALRIKSGVALAGAGIGATRLIAMNVPGSGGSGTVIGNDQTLGGSDIAVRDFSVDLQQTSSTSQAAGVLFGSPYTTPLPVVRARVERVEVRNSPYLGIQLRDGCNDFLVAGCMVRDVYYIGIQVATALRGVISHNLIRNTTDNAIDIYGDTGVANSSPTVHDIVVANNECDNVRVGVFFETVAHCTAVGNRIKANEIGVVINRINSEPRYNAVIGNGIVAGMQGIRVFNNCFETNITGNNIQLSANGAYGIELSNTSRGTLTGNSVCGNGNADAGIGIRFYNNTHQYTAVGNFFRSIQTAITVEDTSSLIDRVGNFESDTGTAGTAWQNTLTSGQMYATTLRTGQGATVSRPSASGSGAGTIWYDTDFKKLVWSTGTAWILAGDQPRTTFSNADYTAQVSDRILAQIGTLSAARVVTLPAANAVAGGTVLQIVDESRTVTGTFTISWARAGSDTINGATVNVVAVNAAGGTGRVMSDGASKWTTV